VAVSALTGAGLPELIARADAMVWEIERRDDTGHEPLALAAQGG
jgi:hypothetical protein